MLKIIYIAMLILNIYIFTNNIMKIKKKKSSRYHCCPNIWNSEDSNPILLIFWLICFYRCVDLGKILKNDIYLFSFGQRMMWDNVVNLSHILCQQIQLWKLYN
jgi:hypothetical protein